MERVARVLLVVSWLVCLVCIGATVVLDDCLQAVSWIGPGAGLVLVVVSAYLIFKKGAK